MSSRATVAALALCACGTSNDVVRHVDAEATFPVRLTSEGGDVPDATISWTVVRQPESSHAAAPDASELFTPDVRGGYVIDRWIHYGVSDDLTDEFVVSVAGAPPMAMITGSAQASVGVAVTLDGTASTSPEARPLTYAWRLATRPRDSVATLTSDSMPTTSLIVDKAGPYSIELSVFDGELWSMSPGDVTVTAQ